MLSRRSLLRGLIAAPAIVTASNIMPVRALVLPETCEIFPVYDWAVGQIFVDRPRREAWRVVAVERGLATCEIVPMTREPRAENQGAKR